MRVGIDYLPAVTQAWGLGRYARELVRALVRLPDAPILTLFEVGGAPRRVPYSRLGLQGAELRRIPLRIPRRLAQPLARFLALGPERLAGGLDLFHHVQAPLLPSRRARQVLTVAELPPGETQAQGELARLASDMDGVVVFSRSFAAEVAARLALDPARVHALPIGCDHWSRELEGSALQPARPARILVLGAVRAERSPELVVAAFERLIAGGREAELLFVGRAGSGAEQLEQALQRSPAAAHVRWEREPDDEAMPRTMARASVLVHLAREVGSPITPLEACAAGVSVVASRLPVIEECLGDLALWHEKGDGAQALADRIDHALDSAADEDARSARKRLAASYSWDRHARSTLEYWNSLLALPIEAPAGGRDRP
jgi:glycosyltransferase involved in cell wall biosynthesis